MRKTRKLGDRVIPIRPKKKELPARVCACKCGERFIPKDPRQIYFSHACANRVQQRKLRARARIGA